MNYTKKELLTKGGFQLINYLPSIGIEKVREEIIAGLKTIPKYIASKFFYDEKGSELFEKITQLNEYYPTRTEKKILSTIVSRLNVDFTNINIVDIGSGDPTKIRLLFSQLSEQVVSTIIYYPVDISQSAIEKAAEKLILEFPMLKIKGIVADFIFQLKLLPKTKNRLFCFFGSTVGNLSATEIEFFMNMLGNEMQQGDNFLLGIDMIKDVAVLENAYNDEQQITAQFNKNILKVVNNLSGTNFNPNEFEHLAFFNAEKNSIEMHLKALKNVAIIFDSSTDKVYLKKGETIHTENSHKFNFNKIKTIGLWAGLDIEKVFADDNRWFNVVHYKKNK